VRARPPRVPRWGAPPLPRSSATRLCRDHSPLTYAHTNRPAIASPFPEQERPPPIASDPVVPLSDGRIGEVCARGGHAPVSSRGSTKPNRLIHATVARSSREPRGAWDDGKEFESSIDLRSERRCQSSRPLRGLLMEPGFSLLLRWLGRLIAKSPLPNIPTGFLARAAEG
jgi:hypothetical protein